MIEFSRPTQVRITGRGDQLPYEPVAKAARVYAALLRDGWKLTRQRGSHRLLRKDDRTLVFAHHDVRELGRVQLAQLAREAGYTMNELRAIL
jgi:predicted RNA binding protein YcfA (HicA-like mRNA interferase family)